MSKDLISEKKILKKISIITRKYLRNHCKGIYVIQQIFKKVK